MSMFIGMSILVIHADVSDDIHRLENEVWGFEHEEYDIASQEYQLIEKPFDTTQQGRY